MSVRSFATAPLPYGSVRFVSLYAGWPVYPFWIDPDAVRQWLSSVVVSAASEEYYIACALFPSHMTLQAVWEKVVSLSAFRFPN